MSVERLSLKSRIADVLREEILSGQLPDGERLVERCLASRFEVSLAPVRESLIELYKEGWVDNQPRKGTQVRSLQVGSSVRQPFRDMRLAIEAVAVVKAAESIDQLRSVLIEAERADSSHDNASFPCSDYRFHRAIVESFSDRHLLNVWLAVISGARMHPGDVLRAEFSCSEALSHHQRILGALDANDLGLAKSWLLKNLNYELKQRG